jgi:hypothetical protein
VLVHVQCFDVESSTGLAIKSMPVEEVHRRWYAKICDEKPPMNCLSLLDFIDEYLIIEFKCDDKNGNDDVNFGRWRELKGQRNVVRLR